jgi:PAS domain S-box-containing protein
MTDNEDINNREQYIIDLEAKISSLEHENAKLKDENVSLHLGVERFSKTFYNNHAWMVISRLIDGVFIDVNESYANSMGFNRIDMIGKSALELGMWADPEERQFLFSYVMEHGYIRNFESKFMKISGEIGIALSSIEVMEINGERCLLTSAVDITERKAVEEALERSRKLLSQMFNNMPLPIIIATATDNRIVEVNDTFLKRNKLVRETLLGQDISSVADLDNADEFRKLIKENGIVTNYETSFYAITGERRTILLSGVLICWEGEECILSIGNDITELRQYQSEISRLDNLNLMGQMAASIAHEVRNPMTSLKGFLQLFQSQYKYSEDKDVIELMIEEIDRVNEIITTFLSLARKNTINLQPQSLNDSIINLQPLIIADALKHDVYVDINLNHIPKILIDESEFRQLLLNLARNAIQAMPEGGTLTIKTLEDNHGVKMVVQDEGQGIPPEIMEKIGTPFSTTKENGTGLGMAVCYSIAERHNAKIEIRTGSEGTSFSVTFPVVA